MKERGLQPAESQPDVTVTYYLLLNTNMSPQTMGQFLRPRPRGASRRLLRRRSRSRS